MGVDELAVEARLGGTGTGWIFRQMVGSQTGRPQGHAEVEKVKVKEYGSIQWCSQDSQNTWVLDTKASEKSNSIVDTSH